MTDIEERVLFERYGIQGYATPWGDVPPGVPSQEEAIATLEIVG